MANPLPVVTVASLTDVERLATHGGPQHIILMRADSISEARAMLTVLRAKGVLRQHGGGDAFPDYPDFATDPAPAEESSDSDVGEVVWAGWVAEAEHEEDLDVRLLLSDADSELEGGGGVNGVHVHQGDVAHGWVVENLHPFRRAIDLGIMLEEVASDIIPVLVNNPADADALRRLRRLRNIGRAIRRVGKQLPGLMGQTPVTVGNHLKKTAARALRRATGRAAWMASRCDRTLARVLGLYEEHSVDFKQLD